MTKLQEKWDVGEWDETADLFDKNFFSLSY